MIEIPDSVVDSATDKEAILLNNLIIALDAAKVEEQREDIFSRIANVVDRIQDRNERDIYYDL